jgi:hypothetical protein
MPKVKQRILPLQNDDPSGDGPPCPNCGQTTARYDITDRQFRAVCRNPECGFWTYVLKPAASTKV